MKLLNYHIDTTIPSKMVFQGVGKTSLVLRFIHGTFRESYVPTIEDTYRKVISSKTPNSPPAVCTLHITDTTGSHQFPAMQRLSISKGQFSRKFPLVQGSRKKDEYFTVRLIVRVDHNPLPPPFSHFLVIFFWCVQETGVFWSKTLF